MEMKWQANHEVLSSKIDQEAILMSIEVDSYFNLDPIATRIWEILSQQAASINDLVVLLMEEYEVDEKTCREDVTQFIETMSGKKLIKELA